MAGLAAARRRGRVGGRPTVMTEAKTKQAARMVKAGTPLTEVAEVLGVSRTTLYRHLKTTHPGGVVAAVQRRADLAVLWLHPDPDDPGAVVEARHCRACHPRGRVVDVECTRCGDGPIVTGALWPRTARRVRWRTRPGGGWWPRGGAPRPTSSAPNTDSRRGRLRTTPLTRSGLSISLPFPRSLSRGSRRPARAGLRVAGRGCRAGIAARSGRAA